MSLVPIASLGELLGVPTEAIRHITDWRRCCTSATTGPRAAPSSDWPGRDECQGDPALRPRRRSAALEVALKGGGEVATRGKVVAGALGNCVHVAGAANFLALAEQVGYEPVFLGPAVAVDRFVAAVAEHDPEIVGIGYRLTPEVLPGLLAELRAALAERDLLRGRRYVFGGTPPTAAAATAAGWFERAFTGFETTEEVIAFLRGEELADSDEHYGATQLERLGARRPTPPAPPLRPAHPGGDAGRRAPDRPRSW